MIRGVVGRLLFEVALVNGLTCLSVAAGDPLPRVARMFVWAAYGRTVDTADDLRRYLARRR